MKGKRYLSLAVLALLLYWAIAHPAEAARTTRDIGAGLLSAAESLATFVNALN